MASCVDLDNELDPNRILPVEPPYLPTFQFDDRGIPYRLNSPKLSAEMQQDVLNEFIGYGWKCMQTNEILDDGFVNPVDYFKDSYGGGPKSYYIKSDKELVSYFWFDAELAKAFHAQGFTMDLDTGVLSDGGDPTSVFPGALYLRIWSIYNLDGKWFLDMVSPMGLRVSPDDKSKVVWASSRYYRMSEDELTQMQETYTYEFTR